MLVGRGGHFGALRRLGAGDAGELGALAARASLPTEQAGAMVCRGRATRVFRLVMAAAGEARQKARFLRLGLGIVEADVFKLLGLRLGQVDVVLAQGQGAGGQTGFARVERMPRAVDVGAEDGRSGGDVLRRAPSASREAGPHAWKLTKERR